MALVLLAGAGLLIKSFWKLTSVDTGFHPESVLAANISLPINIYQRPEQRTAFFNETLERVSALPGVTAASFTTDLPFGKIFGIAFKIALETETPAHLAKQDDVFASFYSVSSGLFPSDGNSGNRCRGAHSTIQIARALLPLLVINQRDR